MDRENLKRVPNEWLTKLKWISKWISHKGYCIRKWVMLPNIRSPLLSNRNIDRQLLRILRDSRAILERFLGVFIVSATNNTQLSWAEFNLDRGALSTGNYRGFLRAPFTDSFQDSPDAFRVLIDRQVSSSSLRPLSPTQSRKMWKQPDFGAALF